MNREEMIEKLCFRSEGFYLSGKVPTRFVTVGGTPDLYTTPELALLVAFTETKHGDYLRRCGSSPLDWADNFISFYKDGEYRDGHPIWRYKRYTWTQGVMGCASLPEAITRFWGDQGHKEVIGDYVMVRSGEIGVITDYIYHEERERIGTRDAFRYRCLNNDTTRTVSQYDHDVVIAAKSLGDLADAMRMAIEHRIAASSIATDEDVAASLDAWTSSDSPKALTHMWTARVWDWIELSETTRSIPQREIA